MTNPQYYVPKFSHADWIDNVSRVQAGGPDGFNNRFHALEDEFGRLAANINPLVDALSKPQLHLTLVPILAAIGDNPWKQEYDLAKKPSGAGVEAHGTMNIALPTGAGIQSLLVTGNQPSGTLTAILHRHDINNASGSDAIITADKLNQPFQPLPSPSPVELAIVDNSKYRYYITVDLRGATASDLVALFCIQIAYQ